MNMISLDDRYLGCLLGLAVGDAVGTTLEFKPRGSFTPIIDMDGGGPFNLEAGQWTDDTSMALCLAHSLAYRNGFNAEDQMNRYCNWWQLGYMSSTGDCFDIGMTVVTALRGYLESKDPFQGSVDPLSAGNGSLMRLAPIAMFYHPNLELMLRYAGESSRTTHGAEECIDACRYFSSLLHACFLGLDKQEILDSGFYTPKTKKVSEIAKGVYSSKEQSQIQGTGYVIDCLEAALWCFSKANSFEEAILMGANLGDDADTTAAVCGQVAGAYYGAEGIKPDWLAKLSMKDEITELSLKLFSLSETQS
jgi:ADP-ribosyl-[dinitrogen reductase] hydrolase